MTAAVVLQGEGARLGQGDRNRKRYGGGHVTLVRTHTGTGPPTPWARSVPSVALTRGGESKGGRLRARGERGGGRASRKVNDGRCSGRERKGFT